MRQRPSMGPGPRQATLQGLSRKDYRALLLEKDEVLPANDPIFQQEAGQVCGISYIG